MRRGRCAPPRAGSSGVAERRVGGVYRACRGGLRPDRFGPVGVCGDLLRRGCVGGVGAWCRLDRRSLRSAACADRFGCGSGGGFPCDGGDSGPTWWRLSSCSGSRYRAIPVRAGVGRGATDRRAQESAGTSVVRPRPRTPPSRCGGARIPAHVAMQLVGRGEAVNVVQALLGHASLSSTQIYIRAVGHQVREAAHMPCWFVEFLRGIRRDTTSG
jgi:hypothetical protein